MIVGPLAQNSLDEANGKHIIFDILLQLPTQHKLRRNKNWGPHQVAPSSPTDRLFADLYNDDK